MPCSGWRKSRRAFRTVKPTAYQLELAHYMLIAKGKLSDNIKQPIGGAIEIGAPDWIIGMTGDYFTMIFIVEPSES